MTNALRFLCLCLLGVVASAIAAFPSAEAPASQPPKPTPAVGQPKPIAITAAKTAPLGAQAAKVPESVADDSELAPLTIEQFEELKAELNRLKEQKEEPAKSPVEFQQLASAAKPPATSEADSTTPVSTRADEPATATHAPSATAGPACTCDHSRTPYYYSGADGKWYETRAFTPDEAARENARIARLKASAQQPVGNSPDNPSLMCKRCGTSLTGAEASCPNCGLPEPWTPLRAQPPPSTVQLYTAPMGFSGGCAGGNCSVGGFGRQGFFGRRR